MKILRHLVFLILSGSIAVAQSTPGWRFASNNDPQSRADWVEALGDTSSPGTVGLGPLDESAFAVDDQEAIRSLGRAARSEALPSALRTGPVGNEADEITPEIQALAAALKNDPVKIFEFVRNYIDYECYYGSKKGAQLTLMEGSGNDTDQAALLVALLRAGGHTASYAFGPCLFSLAAFPEWWGIANRPYSYMNNAQFGAEFGIADTSEANIARWRLRVAVFETAKLAGYYYVDAFTNVIEWIAIPYTFVEFSDGENTFNLSPAYKLYEPTAGLNLVAATQYNRANLLSSAGGTTGAPDWVTSLNEAGINTQLTNYTKNLISYLRSNYRHERTIRGILGARRISKSSYNSLGDLPGMAPHTGATWGSMSYSNSIPTSMMSKLEITAGVYQESTDTFTSTVHTNEITMPSLGGRKLSLSFAGNTASIRLDEILSGSAFTVSGASVDIRLKAKHGHYFLVNDGGTWVPSNQNHSDQGWTTSYLKNDEYYYAFPYSFGNPEKLLRKRQEQLDVYRRSGADAWKIATEGMNILGLSHYRQMHQMEKAAGNLYQSIPMNHHLFGRAGQEAAFYVDIGLITSAPIQADRNHDTLSAFANATSLFGSAMEHGVIGQTQGKGTLAASTMSVIRKANSDGTPIYRVTSTNKSTVIGQLQNYSPASTSKISALLTEADDRMLLPQSGTITINEWTGGSYAFEDETSNAMVIGRGFNGGYSAYNDLDFSIILAALGYTSDPGSSLGMSTYFPEASYMPLGTLMFSWDPVELSSGAYVLDKADLTLGAGAAPLGLSTSRHYHSNRRWDDSAGIGYGWAHNNDIFITERSAPEALLGGANGYQMAPFIAALVAVKDLHTNHANAKEWATAALVVNWALDRMDYTAVSVTMGNRTIQFIEMPDGEYIAPPGMNLTLTKNGSGHYVMSERHGNTMTFNADNKLVSITNPGGSTQTFTYNGSGQLATVTDAFGRTLTYTWASDRISSISDGTGRSVSYGYSGAGDLTSATDPEGNVWTYQYDSQHRMTSLKDPDNRIIAENDYDADGRVTKQRSMGDVNREWTYLYTGYVNTEINPLGGETRYYHDERGRSVGVENDKGEFSIWGYDGQDRKIIEFDAEGWRYDWYFDADNNLEMTEDQEGLFSFFFYDNALRLEEAVDKKWNSTFYSYTATHQIESKTDQEGNTTSFTYHGNGLPHTITDGSGKTTTTDYDAWGNVNKVTSHDTTFRSFTNNARGDVLTSTDEENRTSIFTWDKNRQLLTTTLPPVPGEPAAIMTHTYDGLGNLATVTDANGNVTSHTYNALSKRLTTTLPALPAGNNVITTAYDERDWAVTRTNSLTPSTITEYDSAGRVAAIVDPLGRRTESIYDAMGRAVEVKDPLDRVTKFVWNARGEGTRTTNPLNHHVDGTFDENGNQTALKNRRDEVYTTTYFDDNRPESTTTPTGKTTSMTYHGNGLIHTITEPSGQPTTLLYNGKNLLSSKADPTGTVTFSYDDSGLPETVTEGTTVLTREYDDRGRLTKFITADGDEIGYKYDPNGNLTRIVYPDGKQVNYTYNARNLLETVTDWSSRTTTYNYDRLGRLTGMERPNGTTASFSHDDANQLTEVRENSGGKLISYLRLDHDDGGQIERRFRAPLVQSGWEHPQVAATYDADNRLATVNSTSVVHDADGNMTNGPITPDSGPVNLIYNSRNQLTSAGGLTYVYDAEGRRRSITDASGTIRDVIDPNSSMSRLLVRHQADGSKTFYVYGLGLLYEVDEADNTKTYHFDQVGSTILRTDDAGQELGWAEYSAYGLIVRKGGDMDTPFLYNGQLGIQTDANGLLNMRARYYSPYLMRFLNADPIGFSGGLNWFAYADGNPISVSDPFGLWGWRNTLSLALDFIPIVGTVKAAVEVVAGYDFVAGESVNRGVAAAGLVAGLIPGGKAAVKGTSEAVQFAARYGDEVVEVTQKLSRHVDDAVKHVDDLGMNALTARQQSAALNNPNLYDAFRGNRIDVYARDLVRNDPRLSHLTSNYTRGADFVDDAAGVWWDMTTSRAWQRHVDKYGPNGIHLSTDPKGPLFNGMDYLLNGLLNGTVGNSFGNK